MSAGPGLDKVAKMLAEQWCGWYGEISEDEATS